MKQITQIEYLNVDPKVILGDKTLYVMPKVDMALGDILKIIMAQQGLAPELYDQAVKHTFFNVGGIMQRAMDFVVKAGVKVGFIPIVRGG